LRRVVHRYDGAQFGKSNIVRLGRSRVDSILNEFMAMSDDLNFFADAPAGINCLSGFILFTNGKKPVLENHAPEHRCRHVIQGCWPVKVSDEVQITSLLAHLLRGCFLGDPDATDKINLLAEVAGAAVLGRGTHLMKPKAIVLKGITAENGKSQIVDVI
jgi:phage/plasmid-associated DNA primase